MGRATMSLYRSFDHLFDFVTIDHGRQKFIEQWPMLQFDLVGQVTHPIPSIKEWR